MRRTSVLLVCVFALATAVIAKSVKFSFSLPKAATIGSVELKSGDYDVRVDGTTAVIAPKLGGQPKTVPARVEELAAKYAGSTVTTVVVKDGKTILDSVTVGGSKTKIVFGQ
jgi:hypothetical protein